MGDHRPTRTISVEDYHDIVEIGLQYDKKNTDLNALLPPAIYLPRVVSIAGDGLSASKRAARPTHGAHVSITY